MFGLCASARPVSILVLTRTSRSSPERGTLVRLVGEKRVEVVAQCAGRSRPGAAFVASSELQQWQRLLAGLAPPAADDLPTVYLPLRLAAALSTAERVSVVADAIAASDEDVQQAILFEMTATSVGLTMQTWLLAALVRGDC